MRLGKALVFTLAAAFADGPSGFDVLKRRRRHPPLLPASCFLSPVTYRDQRLLSVCCWGS